MSIILITGATGLLGSTLAPVLAASGHRTIRHGRASSADACCDLTDPRQALELVDHVKPDVIVNLVAVTDVDRCEANPNEAYRGNVLTVENICRGIKDAKPDTHLVQISTDMVYDGQGPNAENRVVIRNTYALSKLASELAASEVSHTVLRTNFLGRSKLVGRSGLTDWLFGALTKRAPITVFDDVLFNPLSMQTLCAVLTEVVNRRPAGVFNVGSRDGFSKAQLAFDFASWLELGTEAVSAGTVDSMGSLKARRPKDMRMICSRFTEVMRLTLPTLAEEVRLVAEEYR